MKNKNHVNISTGAGKASDKILYAFTIKALKKSGIEGCFFTLMKDIYKNPHK